MHMAPGFKVQSLGFEEPKAVPGEKASAAAVLAPNSSSPKTNYAEAPMNFTRHLEIPNPMISPP